LDADRDRNASLQWGYRRGIKRPMLRVVQTPEEFSAKENRVRRSTWRERMDEKATRPRPDLCENCGTVGKRGVVFDHDHSTGEFRGWLCDNCNRALGLLNDDMERILGLALYLEKARCGTKVIASLQGKGV
jgi:hypothetical protein